MPIFHDPDLRLASDRDIKATEFQPPTGVLSRRLSEESIQTEFCDGPEPEAPRWITALEDQASAVDDKQGSNSTSNREDLIKRIKRGESPTWIPSQTVCTNS